MRTRFSLLPPLLACALGGCASQTTGSLPAPLPAPLPEYAVARATNALQIDGRLDDAAWSKAAVLTLGFPWDAQSGAKQATTVRLLWDDRYLYVAYDCADADITARHTRRDDPTWEDDAVELFISPAAGSNSYVGLEMNARGVLYDYLNKFPHSLDKTFDLDGVLLAARRDGTLNQPDQDRGWTLEVAIPLAALQALDAAVPAAPGVVWSANLNRWDGSEPHRRLSMWSASGRPDPNPHAPQRFGRLRFVR